MNCAGCPNPGGWEEPAKQGLDLLYSTFHAASKTGEEPEERVVAHLEGI